MADKTGATEMREVLANATDPLTVSEIYALTTLVSSTVAVAVFVKEETKAGRMKRTGEVGSYRYALSADGRKALNRKVAKAIEVDAELGEQRASPPIQSVKQLIAKRAATQHPKPEANAKSAPAQRQPDGQLGAILASIAHLAHLHDSVAAELRSLRESLALHRPPPGE